MKENRYTGYPDGFRRLQKDIIPFYFRPAKSMLMRLLLTILTDG